MKINWKIFAFLALMVFIVYFNSLGNDFVSDDIAGISQNPYIGDVSHLFSKPMAFPRDIVYFIVYKLGGLNPALFRLINILFHLGSTWLVFLLLMLLANPVIAFFSAGVFAVHPLQSEAVTWISGGPYSQYSFFFLLSLLLYLFSERKKSTGIYLGSLIAFLLSLLSTEKAAILPLILIVYEWSFGNVRSNWKRTLPFFTLSGLWFLILLFGGAIRERISSLQGSYYQQSGLENPFIQIPVAISSYLKLIFVPIGLTLYHSEEILFTTPVYIIRLLVFLAFLAAIAISFKKNRQIFFWLSFFVISLFPTLTPLKISWIVAERYVYLGTIGIIVPVAVLIEYIGRKISKPKIAYVILTVLLFILGSITILRNNDWKNQDTLWLAAAKTSPSSPQNHNNLGDYYMRNGNFAKAAEEFTMATQLIPNYGDAYHNLANVYYQVGKYDKALENYKKAIASNPNLWQSYQNIASVYYDLKQYPLAIENLKKALAINPNNANLHTVMGIFYLQTKNKTEAQKELEQALLLNPNDQKAKQLLLSF